MKIVAEQTLQHLEREPIIFSGLTYSELKSITIKSILIATGIGTIVGFIFPMGLIVAKSIIGLLVMILFTFVLCKHFAKKLTSLRSDKPPFYDLQWQKRSSPCFIRASAKWSRCRTKPPSNAL